MTSNDHHGRMVWRHLTVAGRTTRFGMIGSGRPLIFLHGWGLSGRCYEPALRLLAESGVRVYAPSLPGFGGTDPLPAEEVSLAGYARWVAEFAEALDITEPVVLVGHSFGGGVAIRTAHDVPELVDRLVLVNSIGGSAWVDGRGMVRPMRERPLWDWGLRLQDDVRRGQLPRVVREAVPNLLRNPGAVWRVANLARGADLAAELTELRRRRVPVTIAWGEKDTVIPEAALAALCGALGDPHCVRVPGGHGWLIDDPHLFARVLATALLRVLPSARPEPESAVA